LILKRRGSPLKTLIFFLILYFDKAKLNKLPDPEELLNFLEFDPVATYLFCAAAEKLG
jgi:hypothetical protein